MVKIDTLHKCLDIIAAFTDYMNSEYQRNHTITILSIGNLSMHFSLTVGKAKPVMYCVYYDRAKVYTLVDHVVWE